MAHDLAKTPWGAPRPLPETLATMTPQAYNAIRYDEKQSLWNNIEGRQLDVQFFHMGMVSAAVCACSHWINPRPRRVRSTSDRNCSVTVTPVWIPNNWKGQSDLGFAGFRAFKAPELARRDIVSFLG